MKFLKIVFGFIGNLFLGLFFLGSIDIDEIKFRKNILKLKKEYWFKELSDNALYYDKIYQNQVVRDYLCQDNIVEKIIDNEQEKSYFISLLK